MQSWNAKRDLQITEISRKCFLLPVEKSYILNDSQMLVYCGYNVMVIFCSVGMAATEGVGNLGTLQTRPFFLLFLLFLNWNDELLLTVPKSKKQYKNGSFLMTGFGFWWRQCWDMCVLLDVVQKSLCSIIRLSFISTSVSIFSTVPSALEAFKHLLILYDDLNEIEKQVFSA